MKRNRPMIHLCLLLAACAAVVNFTAVTAVAQHVPGVKGSLDAVTVLPTTRPSSAATQPTVIPAGHPQITTDTGASASALHAGMAGAKTGALRVNVSPAIAGVATVIKDSARVELLSKGVVIKTYLTRVDEKGIIELHDLPLDVAFQPVVTILHAGAEQQMVGASMNKYQPAIEFDMPVYEITAEKPDWTIGLRNIECEAVSTGKETYLRATDLIGAFNPANRAWTGEPTADGRRTLAVALPTNAGNVQYGPGMAEAGAKVVKGTVVRGKTMLPGSSQYILAYDVPVKDGKAAVTFTAPADTTLFALYVPGEWTIGKTIGLEASNASGTHAAGKAQLLKAKNIKAGTVLSVEVSGVKVVPAEAKPGAIVDQKTDLNLPLPQKKQ